MAVRTPLPSLPKMPRLAPSELMGMAPALTLTQILAQMIGTDILQLPSGTQFVTDVTTPGGDAVLRISAWAGSEAEQELISDRLGRAMLNLYGLGRGPLVLQTMTLPDPP